MFNRHKRLFAFGAALLGILSYSSLSYGQTDSSREVTVSNSQHVTELWEGKVLTASFRAGMCFGKDGSARGVLILKHRNGHEDVYHLYGTKKGNAFDLSHSSGHIFKGMLTQPDKMEGKVRLGNGMSFSLSGKRRVNVPLLAEDCAPLPAK